MFNNTEYNLDDEFDEGFQVGILSLMYKDSQFLGYASENLKPNFFANKDLAWFFNAMRSHYANSRQVITERALRDRLKVSVKEHEVDRSRVNIFQQLFKSINSDELSDAGHLQDRVVEFVKRSLMKKAFSEAYLAYEKGEYEGISSLFDKAYQKSDLLVNTGQSYLDMESFDERMHRKSLTVNTIPTGVGELDNYLRGRGLGEKELGVILAPTNRGKSMFLKSIAEYNMFKGRKGLIFTLEMSEDRYFDRFDMSVANMTSDGVNENKDKVRNTIESLKNDPKMGQVHIKEYPTKGASVDTLRAYCERLRRGGFFPDFIVVDYADLLNSSVKYSEERHVQSHIYKRLRGWAAEDNLPIWTATQANRGSLSKSQVTIADISEDFGKAMIADVIVALCQTKQEKQNEQMRLLLTKNRDSTAGVEALINTDFAHGKFVLGS
jgi:replicative DNA helicase